MNTDEVKRNMLDFQAKGWVPNQLACQYDGKLVELISYPFPSDDGGSILIYARTQPGNPCTNQLWILKGEKFRDTDEPETGLRDLRLVTAVCSACGHKFQPKCTGEYRNCYVICPWCRRDYYATYDKNGVVKWEFHGSKIILNFPEWRTSNTNKTE
jgi:hypothetical protein